MNFLDNLIINFNIDVIPVYYLWIFICISQYLENVFPPYPGDSVLIFTGVLLGLGKISLFSCLTSLYIGNIAGALTMYYFGPRIVDFLVKVFNKSFTKEFKSDQFINKVHNWFEKYGVATIIFSRFTATFRFFVAIVAGIAKINIFLFIATYTIGSILWISILVGTGYFLGNNKELIFYYLKLYNIAIFIIAILFFGIYTFIKYKKKKVNQN